MQNFDTPLPGRTCGTMEAYFADAERYPQVLSNRAELEQRTAELMMAPAFAGAKLMPVTIPVVVHVVWRTAAENISDAQIASQIHVLNEAFSATNADIGQTPAVFSPRIGNAQIQFVLAAQAPDGSATTGITRTATTVSAFGTEHYMKAPATGGIAPWDPARYLNIWVCTLKNGLLGYAQFPGNNPATDGVVVRNTAFGSIGTATAPFNLGRTAVHEVGHFLDLVHIWGDGMIASCADSDYVADTPNQLGPNYNDPTFPRYSCSGEPDGDMFMNYMDYVNDRSMVMFTQGQVDRMRAALAVARPYLGV